MVFVGSTGSTAGNDLKDVTTWDFATEPFEKTHEMQEVGYPIFDFPFFFLLGCA